MPNLAADAIILACSPRLGGNTDYAAALVHQTLPGLRSSITRTADLPVRPCSACGHCSGHPGTCSLDEMPDRGTLLLRTLCETSLVCLVSPVYFYHLPGHTKGLLDRAQAFWSLPPAQKPGQGKKTGLILLAARQRGKNLFAGSLLSLRYALESLGLCPVKPLLLRGLDEANALALNPEAQEKICSYALWLYNNC